MKGFGFSLFLFVTTLNVMVGFIPALIGGIPICWILCRWKARSPWPWAASGTLLGLAMFVLLIAMGMGAPSDRPMPFVERISRQQTSLAVKAIAGCAGGAVFWLIAIRDKNRSGLNIRPGRLLE